jgi:hypothetical protein
VPGYCKLVVAACFGLGLCIDSQSRILYSSISWDIWTSSSVYPMPNFCVCSILLREVALSSVLVVVIIAHSRLTRSLPLIISSRLSGHNSTLKAFFLWLPLTSWLLSRYFVRNSGSDNSLEKCPGQRGPQGCYVACVLRTVIARLAARRAYAGV